MRLKDVPKEMRERIIRAMDRTWDTIASDVLEANDGKDLPRNHVIEIVLDADHIHYHGNDEEAYKVLKELPYSAKMALGKEAFKCRFYGL